MTMAQLNYSPSPNYTAREVSVWARALSATEVANLAK